MEKVILIINIFFNAINKYGWDNIEHKILMTNLSAEKAAFMEKEYIKKYDSMNPQKGYNLTSGGDNIVDDVKISETTRKKHSEIQKELWKNNADFRYKLSGNNCHFHKDKYIFYGKDNVTSKKTVLVNTGEIFDCQRDAAKAYNVGKDAVNKCCKGKTKYGGKDKEIGYLIWMDYDDYIKKSEDEINQILLESKKIYSNHHKKVLNLSNMEIYPTASFLSKKINIKLSTLTKYIKNNQDINGTKYVYLNDYCKNNDINIDTLIQKCKEVWE